VTYLVAIRALDDRYYASWECAEWHEISLTRFWGASPDNAVAFAKGKIAAHQSHAHRQSSVPSGRRPPTRTFFPSAMLE
jgi:hypothetical protein